MNRQKKIFLIISALFILAMIIIGIDISRRTTFPGSKGYLKESLTGGDSTEVSHTDSTDEHTR